MIITTKHNTFEGVSEGLKKQIDKYIGQGYDGKFIKDNPYLKAIKGYFFTSYKERLLRVKKIHDEMASDEIIFDKLKIRQ